jgi:hypothetical protein
MSNRKSAMASVRAKPRLQRRRHLVGVHPIILSDLKHDDASSAATTQAICKPKR